VSAVLRVRAVSKRFGELHALREVSFELAAGEIVAVVGPNGAGKTTLLSIVAGAQRPSSGTVGEAGAGGRVGWVPQELALYAKLSVAENLRLFARLEGVREPEAAVARMLEQAGLAARAHERLERLSGGNRQRVNVAAGLIADPPVLALDEPSTALDPGQRERLWRFISARARSGTGVVFSTHAVEEARRHAARVLVLDEGALRFDGSPHELMERAGEPAGGDFERAFLSLLRDDDRP
jgi:ABC-2 type transport system ATP-binding protein